MQDFLEYVRATLRVRSKHHADSDSEDESFSILSEHQKYDHFMKTMTQGEKRRVKQFVQDLRAIQSLCYLKHECPEDPEIKKKYEGRMRPRPKKGNFDNDRKVIEMQM